MCSCISVCLNTDLFIYEILVQLENYSEYNYINSQNFVIILSDLSA